MLDFNDAIAESMEISRADPGAASGWLDQVKQSSVETQIDHLEANFSRQREETATWILRAWGNLLRLEDALVDGDAELSAQNIEQLLEIATEFERSSERIALWTAKAVTSFRKTGRQFRPISDRMADYAAKYATRIERVTDKDIEAILDIADHFRAIARSQDKSNKTSETFDSIDDVLGYLRSA